jgi:hypothetical protein
LETGVGLTLIPAHLLRPPPPRPSRQHLPPLCECPAPLFREGRGEGTEDDAFVFLCVD